MLELLELHPIEIIILPAYKTDDVCISNHNIISKYPNLRDAIDIVENNLIHRDSSGFAYSADPLEAYQLLTQIEFNYYPPKEDDYFYILEPYGSFECIIKYRDNYYKIIIELGGVSIREDTSYEKVKITTKDINGIRLLTIEPSILELWHPFNNNVLFINELDIKIRLILFNGREVYDKFSILSNDKAGVYIRIFDLIIGHANQTILTYNVIPYNLEGKIIVKRVPGCMTEEEAKMLFGIVGLEVRFPKYLPEGYEYECTIHVDNLVAKTCYSTEEIRKYDETFRDKLYNEGKGLTITASVSDITPEEWYAKYKEYSPHARDIIFLNMDNKTIIIYSMPIIKGPKYHILDLYYNGYLYKIEGMISIKELLKIAESL
ncbi:MAG: hypothetical protein KatS3mg003_1304 [Candidatus Nitrosocaldaceae archaeon]|nr:MAG: hypothetical protein KatS3mg003_1304 [Candidatus Nitrosocaldaceae archaeon]